MRRIIDLVPFVVLAVFPVFAGDAIERVRTDVAGFVGMAAKGSLDTPTVVTGTAQFCDLFGDLDPSLANYYLAPSVAAFFQNGGARCVIVRVGSNADEAYIGSDFRGRRSGLQALRVVHERPLPAPRRRPDERLVPAPGVPLPGR